MKLRKKDAIIILSLVFLSLWVRLSTLMMVHTGVDERDYWFAAKAISQGLPYPELSHRTVRWAVILPVALAQSLFGSHPNAYYVMPLLAALSQAVLVYLLGRALNGRLAGSLASIALTFFPYQIRAASQVRPEIFSMTYVLLAALALVRYVRSSSDRARISAAVLAALATFLAYEAKITNLFFMPGIAIAILLYSKGKGLKDALAYGGVLAGLYLAETAAYAALRRMRSGISRSSPRTTSRANSLRRLAVSSTSLSDTPPRTSSFIGPSHSWRSPPSRSCRSRPEGRPRSRARETPPRRP
ncbi:MAG TPA: glycosyltransferase family 39 protein [Treponemataceae bacterium]|nr:glycosyltransferase family 39 protein [Treponemataceae bacterium]